MSKSVSQLHGYSEPYVLWLAKKIVRCKVSLRENSSARDPDLYTGPRKYYLFIANWIRKNVTEAYGFNAFIVVCILITGVIVGITVGYENMEDNQACSTIDFVITWIFATEIVLKIVAEGFSPWVYFSGKESAWNAFDFTICVAGFGLSDSSIKLLRLMRLLRATKIIGHVEQIQVILMGLLAGIRSMGYILLLIFVIFYVFAIVGVMIFRENDPFHFAGLPLAVVTLWRCATLEDWTDVMYTEYFGCNKFPGIYVPEKDWMPENGQIYGRGLNRAATFWCTNRWDPDDPLPRLRAAAYFITFITIASFIMLSLFIGSVTMGMAEGVENTNQIKTQASAGDMMQSEEKLNIESSPIADPISTHQNQEDKKNADSSLGHESFVEEHKANAIYILSSFQSLKAHVLHLKKLFETPDHDLPELKALLAGSSDLEFDLLDEWERIQVVLESNPYHEGVRKRYYDLTLKARKIETSRWFNNSITFTICIAGLMVGITVHDEFSEAKNDWIKAINACVLSIFILEICVKIVARGFTWWRFFGNGWNNFDFTIVLLTICIQDAKALPMLRLFRLFRVLKLLDHFPQLAVIVNAVFHGLGSVAFVMVLLMFSTFMFAVFGIVLFRENDPWHFESLHIAMFTLFRCATLEDWSDVMYINMLGCDKWGYSDFPERCTNPNPSPFRSVIYFFVFVVFTGFIELTLFIAVVTTGMTEAHKNMSKLLKRQRSAKEVVDKLSITPQEIDLYSKIFEYIDKNHDGELTEEEILSAMQVTPDSKATEIMQPLIRRSLDLIAEDGNTSVDLGCFMHIMASRRDEYLQKAAAREDKVHDNSQKQEGRIRVIQYKSKTKSAQIHPEQE